MKFGDSKSTYHPFVDILNMINNEIKKNPPNN